jgi:myo-inositol-1(or 4)-monophosphatase
MELLTEQLRVCEKAVREAGATIQDWVGRTSVKHKGPADLVTEADFAAQEAVRAIVLGAFPDHCLLGEEGQVGCDGARRPEYRWIVDPLDGTTNFVHGVPHYAVSLALERNGHLVLGAVFNPCLNECFTAVAGHGARLNGQPIRTSGVTDLGDALAGTGFPAVVRSDSPDLLVFNQAVYQCEGVRRSGSAALNLCDLAAGRFDVVWGFSTKVWDVAAGLLIIQEAGGVVSSPEGGDFVLDEARFLAAANPTLYLHLRELVRQAVGK